MTPQQKRAIYATERKIRALAERIEKAIALFDSIELLNDLNLIAVAAGLAEQGHANAPDGFGQKFRYLRNLAAKRALHPPAPGRTASIEMLFKLVDELFIVISGSWMAKALSLIHQRPHQASSIEAWFMSRIRDLVELPLGSSSQYRQLVLDRFARFDDSVIKGELGLATAECVLLIDTVGVLCGHRLQEFLAFDEQARREIGESHERMLRGELDFQRAVATARSSQAVLNAKEARRRLFTVSAEQISTHAGLSRASVDAFLERASVLPGHCNDNYTLPTDKPDRHMFFRLGGDTFYVLDVFSLHRDLFNLVKTVVTSSGSKAVQKYADWRGKVTPKNVAATLSSVFGRENVFENLYYSPTGQAEDFAEADILVKHGGAVLLCEVKGHELNRDISDPVGPERMARDFKTIQEGYEQCQRTRNYICGKDPALFYKDDHKTVILTLSGPVLEFHYLVVTANSYGVLAGNCSDLLKRGSDDPLPVVMSELELATMLEYIKDPLELLKYLRQRVLLHGVLRTHDELEPAGVFVTQGSLDDLIAKKLSGECDLMTLSPDVSFVFNGPDWERDPETDEAIKAKKLTMNIITAESVLAHTD